MTADKVVQTRGRDLNHVAWLYDPLVEKLSFGRERRFRQRTVELLTPLDGEAILDVGCGTGSLTLLVGRRYPHCRVTGIDAAPRMIAIARHKAARYPGGSAVRFAPGVAEELEFADASFDWVVNSMFTHHIDSELKRLAMAEMYRVLRPGGRLVTADIDRPTTLLAAATGWLSRYLLLQPELEDNLLGLLADFMRGAGFVDIKRHGQVYGLVSFFSCRKPGGE